MVNGATDLPPAVRDAVAATWGCPVIDLYGLRETGPLAASTDGDGHVVVPRRVWVEILDEQGRPVPDGQRGEVVVTVDENPYLPLLRYRTGDTAALVARPPRHGARRAAGPGAGALPRGRRVVALVDRRDPAPAGVRPGRVGARPGTPTARSG